MFSRCSVTDVTTKCPSAQTKRCNIIMNSIFQVCRTKLGPIRVKEYVESCKFDVCIYHKNKKLLDTVICKAIEGFARECEQSGVIANWRRVSKCGKFIKTITHLQKEPTINPHIFWHKYLLRYLYLVHIFILWYVNKEKSYLSIFMCLSVFCCVYVCLHSHHTDVKFLIQYIIKYITDIPIMAASSTKFLHIKSRISNYFLFH